METANAHLAVGQWRLFFFSPQRHPIDSIFQCDPSAAYIFGDRIKQLYRWLFCLSIFFGAASTAENIWSVGDLLNGITVIINDVGLLVLISVVVIENKNRLK
ncbi:MAG TPA: hypothetical protein ENN22_14580 [bacterium]|nr:hypothetical protein [bacterium]